MMSNQKETAKKDSSQGQSQDLIGSKAWEKIRAEWTKNPDPSGKKHKKSKPVSDSYRDDVYEILKSVKAPYPAFKHYISLEDMVDIMMEVLEDEQG